jgi:mycothiol synthase
MVNQEPITQLRMAWPAQRLVVPPEVRLPAGYALRTYRAGDEPRFYEVMALAGWPGWNEERLRPWRARILPEGWFFAVHAASDQIVATAMSVHDHQDWHPFGGELGWVAGDPAHAGRGLGKAVVGAVTARLLGMGYRNIHLFTEDYRLPALRTYLKIGYVPMLYDADMPERWRAVCEQVGWPFTPEQWIH